MSQVLTTATRESETDPLTGLVTYSCVGLRRDSVPVWTRYAVGLSDSGCTPSAATDLFCDLGQITSPHLPSCLF